MLIEIPEFSLIGLIGETTNLKSSFIQKHFLREEVLGTNMLEETLCKRLEKAKLTAVDIINIEEKKNKNILKLAKRYHCMPIAIVLSSDTDGYIIKNKKVSNSKVEEYLKQKGFKKVFFIYNQSEIETTHVERTKLANNKKDVHGPFDIIGDVHGCYDELCELLIDLGYEVEKEKTNAYSIQNRKVIFLGDLVDRGPGIVQVLQLVMSMVKSGQAYCVLGNHDGKLLRKLRGSNVKVIHGLEETLKQLEQEPKYFLQEVEKFLESLVSHYVFDEGNLVVVHAGLKEKLHGRESTKVRDLAMYGETTGEFDEYGLPIRINWSRDYKGNALVVYGHTPQLKARMINNTINIDTGCVYGGKLTAFRYPEREIVEVRSKAIYYESPRPLA